MRAFLLLVAFSLVCGCNRMPDEGPAKVERTPFDKDQLDLFKVHAKVFDRYAKVGYEKLTKPEKVFLCVWSLEGEVNNGGFEQYYFNTSGDHAQDAASSLNAIGAKHTADLVKEANLLFGSAGPSPHRNQRQKQLNDLGNAKIKKMDKIDQEFFKYKDNLEKLLKDYVSEKAEVFIGK